MDGIQIALRREKMGETAPFWRFSAASYPDLEQTTNGAATQKDIQPTIKSKVNNGSRVSNSKVPFGLNLVSIHAYYITVSFVQ